MTDLLQALLDFADRTRIPELLYASGYWSQSRSLSADWARFQEELPTQQSARLEDLLEQETALHAKDAEAAFQCGISLGLELSRL